MVQATEKISQRTRIVICIVRPESVLLCDIFTPQEPQAGEIVSVKMQAGEFLGYARIVAVRKDSAQPYGWRYDARILEG